MSVDDERFPRVRPDDVLDARLGRIGTASVVRVSGEVDLLTAPLLAHAMTAALEKPDTDMVIVDLSEVTFLAPAGLGALAEFAEHCRHRGVGLRVVVDHCRPVVRPIELTDMDLVLTLFHTVDEAVMR